MLKIIGHRGYGPGHDETMVNTYPENSLEGFQDILIKNGDGIEFDVTLSADKIPIILHDAELSKHTVRTPRELLDKTSLELNYDQLEKLNIGKGYKIPTLYDVLNLPISEHNPDFILNIDVKSKNAVIPIFEAITKSVKSGFVSTDNIIISSYHWDTLKLFRELDSNIKLAPCIKTTMLFGKDGVSMPGYRPIGNDYQKDALTTLSNFHEEIGCFAFDTVVTDVKDPLLDFLQNKNIGLLLSTGNDYVGTDKTDWNMLAYLKKKAEQNIPFIIYKADQPLEVKNIVSLMK